MSFRVLVIPEDFRKDEPLLQPIVERMLEACGRPARVRILKDPLLGGVTEALKWERIEEILDRYRNMVDCFLLIVDRDGVETRRGRLDALEAKAREFFGSPDRLYAENAWQEVEVWALAGVRDLPKDWTGPGNRSGRRSMQRRSSSSVMSGCAAWRPSRSGDGSGRERRRPATMPASGSSAPRMSAPSKAV